MVIYIDQVTRYPADYSKTQSRSIDRMLENFSTE